MSEGEAIDDRAKRGEKLFCSPPSFEFADTNLCHAQVLYHFDLVPCKWFDWREKAKKAVRVGFEKRVVGDKNLSFFSVSPPPPLPIPSIKKIPLPLLFFTSQVDLVLAQAVHVLRRAHHEVRRELAPEASRGERRAEQGRRRRRGQRRRRRHD